MYLHINIAIYRQFSIFRMQIMRIVEFSTSLEHKTPENDIKKSNVRTIFDENENEPTIFTINHYFSSHYLAQESLRC